MWLPIFKTPQNITKQFFLIIWLGCSLFYYQHLQATIPFNSPGSSASEPVELLKKIGIDEKLGTQLNLNLRVKKDNGEEVPLEHFFDGKKPVILSFVYYNCPSLCSLHLNGVLEALKELNWTIGNEFLYLTVSFDGTEGPELAFNKKINYLKNYNRPEAQEGWHFLTATQNTLDQFTNDLGFKYIWDEKSQEWAHASALIFLSPQGKVTRYLHGVAFEAEQIKLALNEAATGTIGSVIDRFIWYCYRYDPSQSKYVIYAFRLVQIGGGFIIILLAIFLLPVWRKELVSRKS